MNRKSITVIPIILLTLIISCANKQKDKDIQIVKLNYSFNKVTGDSCLIEKTTYYNDYTISYERYNYYDCSKDLMYRAYYRAKVLYEQEYFDIKNNKPKIKYLYAYNEFGHLTSIILRDIELKRDVKTIINNLYNQKGDIEHQVYVDGDGNKLQEVYYKYNIGDYLEKIDSNIIDHTVIKTYFLKGNKIKEIKNGKVEEWRYTDSGKLKEFIKNPFCKDVYTYYKNNLVQVNSIIKKKSGDRIFEKEIFSYYKNDSIRTKTINENGRRIIENRFYYYTPQSPKSATCD